MKRRVFITIFAKLTAKMWTQAPQLARRLPPTLRRRLKKSIKEILSIDVFEEDQPKLSEETKIYGSCPQKEEKDGKI